jgi:protein TonB
MKRILFTTLLSSFGLIGFAQTKDSSSKSDYGDLLFTAVQIESEFKGGIKSWIDFIRKNLNPEVPANNGAPPGKYVVEVSFVVNADGVLSDIKTTTDPGYGTANEAVRIFKLSPNWLSGYQNGIAVKSRKKQKIAFVVEEDEVKPKKKN